MEFILKIRTFKRGANVICKTVTPGREGACTLQFLNQYYFRILTTTDSHRSNSDASKPLLYLVFHDHDERSNHNYRRKTVSLRCVNLGKS